MDQRELIDAAKQQGGLTSDYQLAQRLGVTTGRVSNLRSGRQAADEAEISMLAEMAGIDLKQAFAAVHKGREKNPAKRAYWERISMQFAAVMISLIALFGVGVSDAKASGFQDGHSINYAKLIHNCGNQCRMPHWKTAASHKFYCFCMGDNTNSVS